MSTRTIHKAKPIALLAAAALALLALACSDPLHAKSASPAASQAAFPANVITQQTDASSIPASLPASVVYGDYAVGSFSGFAVDNRLRFDPWNTAYASPAYRDMLRRVEASGQGRTVVFQAWYPAVADKSSGRRNGARSPYPPAAAQRTDITDTPPRANATATRSSGAQPTPSHIAQAHSANASTDPIPAKGRFPLIILSHGLGGNHNNWETFAEFLVSHGYIVAAPTFISDGRTPRVFDDEDSPYANQATPEEVQQAYALIRREGKVIPNFTRFMFADGKIVPGGIERATTMMQNLFRQRVADVGILAHTMRMLDKGPAECRTALTSIGSTSAARDLCGVLTGRIDGGRIGLSGHSLGSMTSQLALNHLPGISAAMGLNNETPFTWTPEEMYGAGETADGLPVASRKPTLIMIGDEDAFVQNIFVRLFQASVAAAGGDPAIAFPLDAERALPDRIANPQPVALSAYQRAVSDRIFVIARDVDHDILSDNRGRRVPCPAYQREGPSLCASPQRTRKPVGEAALDPQRRYSDQTFIVLGWARLADGTEAYMPHLIRDWYARAWFDWHLKDDAHARQRLQTDDPFGSMTSVQRELR